MPFIIQTLKGKEKIVEAVLRKNGIDSKISPLKEFVICQERPHSYIKDIPQVLQIVEATPEEVEYLLNDKEPEKEDIKIGSLVEVVTGEYEGFTGLVRNIRDGEATVDLNVFGKMLPVIVQTGGIKHVEVGEQWI
jgi:transcription antitermination factor NusG